MPDEIPPNYPQRLAQDVKTGNVKVNTKVIPTDKKIASQLIADQSPLQNYVSTTTTRGELKKLDLELPETLTEEEVKALLKLKEQGVRVDKSKGIAGAPALFSESKLLVENAFAENEQLEGLRLKKDALVIEKTNLTQEIEIAKLEIERLRTGMKIAIENSDWKTNIRLSTEADGQQTKLTECQERLDSINTSPIQQQIEEITGQPTTATAESTIQKLLTDNPNPDVHTIYAILNTILNTYGTAQPLPPTFSALLEKNIGAVVSQDQRLDLTRIRGVVMDAYKHGTGIHVKAVPVAELQPTNIQLTENEIAEYKRLKKAATEAWQRKKAESHKQPFPEKVAHTFTAEQLQKLFPDQSFRLIENGKLLDFGHTIKKLADAWDTIPRGKRNTLITASGVRGGNRIFNDSCPLEKTKGGYDKYKTSIFDTIDQAKGERDFFGRILSDFGMSNQYSTDLTECNALASYDEDFERLANILKTEQTRNSHRLTAWFRAKTQLGNEIWNKLKNITHAVKYLEHYSNNMYVRGETIVNDSADRSARMEIASLFSPALVAQNPHRSRLEQNPGGLVGYGSQEHPLTVSVDEDTMYFVVGANNQGKSQLTEALVATQNGFPPTLIGRSRLDRGVMVTNRDGQYVRYVNLDPSAAENRPLLNVYEVPGLSTFQGIATNTWSALSTPQRGAFDEPMKGTSPAHQLSMTAAQTALAEPYITVLHGGTEVHRILQLLEPEMLSRITPILVEEYTPKTGLMPESSGGAELMALLGLPPELVTILKRSAQEEGIPLPISSDLEAVSRRLQEVPPTAEEQFISTADLKKLGFHGEKGGVGALMIEVLRQKMSKKSNTILARGFFSKFSEQLPDVMQKGLNDQDGVEKRAGLCEAFMVNSKSVLQTNQYLQALHARIGPQQKKLLEQYTEQDVPTHITHLSLFSAILDGKVGRKESAMELLKLAKQFTHKESLDINNYIAPLIDPQSHIYSPDTNQFLSQAPKILSGLQTSIEAEATIPIDSVVYKMQQEAYRSVASHLLNTIHFTSAEEMMIDQWLKDNQDLQLIQQTVGPQQGLATRKRRHDELTDLLTGENQDIKRVVEIYNQMQSMLDKDSPMAQEINKLHGFISASDPMNYFISLLRTDLDAVTITKGKIPQKATVWDIANTYEYLHQSSSQMLASTYISSWVQEQMEQMMPEQNEKSMETANAEILETLGLLAYAQTLQKVNIKCQTTYGDAIDFADTLNLATISQLAGIDPSSPLPIDISHLDAAIKQFEPFSFAADKEVMVESGLNGSGKTTFKNTLGQIPILTRWAKLVPARKATIPDFESIHLAESENTGVDASAFTQSALAVRNVAWALKNSGKRLLLFDEILAGTSEAEGRTCVLATIEYAANQGAHVFLINHDPKVTNKLLKSDMKVGTWGFQSGHKLEKTEGHLDPQSFKVMREMGWPSEVVDYYEFVYGILLKERTAEASVNLIA